jgi:hypothetical protein
LAASGPPHDRLSRVKRLGVATVVIMAPRRG